MNHMKPPHAPPMLYITFSTYLILYLPKIQRISIISYLGADNDNITHNYKIEWTWNIKINFLESLFEYILLSIQFYSCG